MMNTADISHELLVLMLAKVTALLLVAFALLPLVRSAALRAGVWFAVIISLPLIAGSSFFPAVVKIAPFEQAEKISQEWQRAAEPVTVSS